MTYYPPRSTILQNFTTIPQTVHEICVTNFFHFLAPGGLTPGPKFTKRGEHLAYYEIYQPAKFHRCTPTHARDNRYQTSCGQKEKQTSTPVNPTGVYPHMPIADRRSPRNKKSLQHRPSPTMRRNVFHSRHGPRRSSKFVVPG